MMRCCSGSIICLELGANDLQNFAYVPANATATLSSLASLKFQIVDISGAGLPSLPWKGPLNECCCVAVYHKA